MYAITNPIMPIAAQVRYGYSHIRTVSRSGISRSMIRRIRSWEKQITSHTKSATAPEEFSRKEKTVSGEV